MSNWCNCVLILLLGCGCTLGQYRDGISTTVINDGIVGKNYSDYYVNATVEYLFEFRSLQLKTSPARPARVTVECQNATRKQPVLVVLRQAKGVLSWQLPLVVPTKTDKVEYKRTSRTLCPNSNYQEWKTQTLTGSTSLVLENGDMDEEVIIIISSSSSENLNFFLRLDIEEDFMVSISENRSLTVSPSEPRFYEFKWSGEPSSPDTVVLQVDSESDICMVVSIQNISCPVFDLERTVQFEGYRQTVAKRGGITLTRFLFPEGFYIVFVVKGDDTDCSASPSGILRRTKHVTFSFKPSISYEEFIKASVSALFLYLSIYVIAILLSFVYYLRKRSDPDCLNDLVTVPTVDSRAGTTSVYSIEASSEFEDTMGSASRQNSSHQVEGASDDSSLDEIDIDTLVDASFDKHVIRSKRILYVCDLARKNPKVLRKKSLLYFWNLLTVATFYALPVVQLVISSQMVLKETGNQDLCYYNFLCAYPLGFLSDFNHVYSNIGYVLLGLLFVGLVLRRDRMHCNAIANRMELERHYGIPQHYGLLYAMGAALIMEGVLSGCYHVCPNHSNFQFDTSFMYVIAMLCMLKIYHTRHPDINASAYATFGVLALIILVGVAGILAGTLHFFISFTVIHLSMCLWLSGKVYYVGRFGFDIIGRRAWLFFRTLCSEIRSDPCGFFKPTYPSRMVLLILGNMANWALVAVGWTYHLDQNFGTYLLAIFMSNLMLYTIFYIVMKLWCHERLLLQPFVYLVLATLGWGSSLYFFLHKSTSWAVTPAQSRSYNSPCLIMNFYDRHDIWHFLSSFSMFFSFMTLLTLDDDLVHVPRSQISVF